MSSIVRLVAELKSKPHLGPAEAATARRVVFSEPVATPADAEAIIAVTESAASASREWAELFTDALADFVLRQQEPCGHINSAKAEWLIRTLSSDGRIHRRCELEALIHVLEQAETAPSSLVEFILEQLKTQILEPEQPVSAESCALLQRVMGAAAAGGGLSVSRAEADLLLDINEAVRGRANHPAWAVIFARGVGVAILRAQSPVAEAASGLSMFARVMRSPKAVFPREAVSGWATRLAGTAPPRDDAGALIRRIGLSGAYDEAETALIAFLKADGTASDPRLTALIGEAA